MSVPPPDAPPIGSPSNVPPPDTGDVEPQPADNHTLTLLPKDSASRVILSSQVSRLEQDYVISCADFTWERWWSSCV
ncbi:hypothetical protein PC128_g6408 [Phytophthora cactorum]|nr:hypothetical protein PC120_g3594 [Phytophthora cactorum]KAG3197962.1 hypothetical protein PC128_g6408 [Phytophthora cactorum]